MTQEEQKAVEEFTEINLTKKGLYHYNDMQDAFLIGLFKGEKMQSSLPSDLDEAADAYSENILANGEDMFDAIADGFRAGAGWVAGQGVKLHGRILPGPRCNLYIESDCFDRGFGGLNYKFSESNDVDMFVQIRKK